VINQGNDVPEKTIAVFPSDYYDYKDLSKVISPLKGNKKREWFQPHLYNCLPLVKGNEYGFIIKSEFDFGFLWNGGEEPEDTKLFFNQPDKELDKLRPRIESHFGHGIITLALPVVFRTPPKVNIMTINPPNHVLPNITVLTGVIETDNLRRSFTWNLKIQMPNIEVFIPKGTPLSGFIPIPRYFADDFQMVNASEIFSQDLVDEELKAVQDHQDHRDKVEPTLPNKIGNFYKKGVDVYGNKFPDHQK
jgi:hypothetical protein